jgi:hypothetical protein
VVLEEGRPGLRETVTGSVYGARASRCTWATFSRCTWATFLRISNNFRPSSPIIFSLYLGYFFSLYLGYFSRCTWATFFSLYLGYFSSHLKQLFSLYLGYFSSHLKQLPSFCSVPHN